MKKIYNTILKMTAVIAVAFGLTACLEKLPGDYIPEEDAMKTLSDAESSADHILFKSHLLLPVRNNSIIRTFPLNSEQEPICRL